MTAPAPIALARFNPAQPGARGMKIAATGLLVVMAAIFMFGLIAAVFFMGMVMAGIHALVT